MIAAASLLRPPGRVPLNQSLDRGLLILQAFHAGQPEQGVRDLARRLQIERSAAYRLIRTLADAGFLEQNPVSRQYRIGHCAFAVGQQYTRSGALYDIAVAVLRQTAAAEDLNMYFGKRVDTALLYLATVENERSVLRVSPGTQGHLHATALGKALLSAEPNAVLRDLLPRINLVRLTPTTTTARSRLRAELRQIRADGFSLSDEESLYGVVVIGAVVRDAAGVPVGAISASGPKNVFTKRRIATVAGIVMGCAADISARLAATQQQGH